ncbi:hypothetical protein GJ496_009168 [Pomphorhynchus laevis]|nr:hypothetical protein GJ496_009168 [Pomphorhynchus laevis]
MINREFATSQEYRTSHGIGTRTGTRNVSYKQTGLKWAQIAVGEWKDVPKSRRKRTSKCIVSLNDDPNYNTYKRRRGRLNATDINGQTPPLFKTAAKPSSRRLKHDLHNNFQQLSPLIVQPLTAANLAEHNRREQLRYAASRPAGAVDKSLANDNNDNHDYVLNRTTDNNERRTRFTTEQGRKRRRTGRNNIKTCGNPRKKQRRSWSFAGDSFEAVVPINADLSIENRVCFNGLLHRKFSETIQVNECVIIRSPESQLCNRSLLNHAPYLGKIVNVWLDPNQDSMMVSLIWYYHVQQTKLSNKQCFHPTDEVFASQHFDVVNAECIDDTCMVLTYSQYSRYRKMLSMKQCFLNRRSSDICRNSIVPMKSEYSECDIEEKLKTANPVNVFFCRHVYDFQNHRILKDYQIFAV